MTKIKRGDILWIDLGQHPKTHLQSGRRPCIVVSGNKANQSSKTFNIIPGTTKQKKDNFPIHLKISPEDIHGFLGKPTIFLIEQLTRWCFYELFTRKQKHQPRCSGPSVQIPLAGKHP